VTPSFAVIGSLTWVQVNRGSRFRALSNAPDSQKGRERHVNEEGNTLDDIAESANVLLGYHISQLLVHQAEANLGSTGWEGRFAVDLTPSCIWTRSSPRR
jgi:hypothetical protein